MASIYSSAQANYNRQKANANFGRMTQSQHDAARRYAEANNMDYDPNQGYGAKGSFDTQRPEKVRDPNKGEFKGGAVGLAGIGAALGLDKMSPSRAQAEMARRFGGGPAKFHDGTPNPYKKYDNVPESMRQMQIRRYEQSSAYTSHFADQAPTNAQNSSKPKPLSMIEMNKLSAQGGLENHLFGTPVRQKKATRSSSSYSTAPMGYNNQTTQNSAYSVTPMGVPSFGGITI
tara:strand:+ start:1011 stop:1703 length:693 start_codon:yes stop_codon:yes gene_type:complete